MPAEVVILNPRPRPTVEMLLDELEEARCLAIAVELPGAAVQASLAKAKILGMLVNRVEVNDQSANSISNMRNRDEIIHTIKLELGEDAARYLSRFAKQLEKK